jgi:hypothetical protein
MKFYVLHYSKGEVSRKRKETLLLREPRLKDATWVTDYDREEFICDFFQYHTKSPLCKSYMSLQLKHFFTLKDMVDNNIDEAIIFEDDVVFNKGWYEDFQDLTIPDGIDYISLGNFKCIPYEKKLIQFLNNGGTEATWVNLNFAKEFLKEVSFIHTIDTVHYGYLTSADKPLMYFPVCNQTSLLTAGTGVVQTEPMPDWRQVVSQYKRFPVFNFFDCLEEFEKMKIKKKQLEEKFKQVYGADIDIRNFEYLGMNEFGI